MIKVEKVGEKKNVALITLNRPKALNALCAQLMDEVRTLIPQKYAKFIAERLSQDLGPGYIRRSHRHYWQSESFRCRS